MVHDLTKEEAFEEWEEIFKWADKINNEMSDWWRNRQIWDVDIYREGRVSHIDSVPAEFSTRNLVEFIMWVKNNVKD